MCRSRRGQRHSACCNTHVNPTSFLRLCQECQACLQRRRILASPMELGGFSAPIASLGGGHACAFFLRAAQVQVHPHEDHVLPCSPGMPMRSQSVGAGVGQESHAVTLPINHLDTEADRCQLVTQVSNDIVQFRWGRASRQLPCRICAGGSDKVARQASACSGGGQPPTDEPPLLIQGFVDCVDLIHGAHLSTLMFKQRAGPVWERGETQVKRRHARR